MGDGNGHVVDEQLFVVGIKWDETGTVQFETRFPTIFLDLVPDEKTKESHGSDHLANVRLP